MSRLISACPDPDCDSTRITINSGNGMKEGEQHWYCRDCHNRFDSPNRREPQSHGGAGGSTLAAKLAAADPEEVAR